MKRRKGDQRSAKLSEKLAKKGHDIVLGATHQEGRGKERYRVIIVEVILRGAPLEIHRGDKRQDISHLDPENRAGERGETANNPSIQKKKSRKVGTKNLLQKRGDKRPGGEELLSTGKEKIDES